MKYRNDLFYLQIFVNKFCSITEFWKFYNIKCSYQVKIPRGSQKKRLFVSLHKILIKLFFSSPENVKSRNDLFYLQPERSCVPDSPVWYSTQDLNQQAIDKMLRRILMVREVQEHMLADNQQ